MEELKQMVEDYEMGFVSPLEFVLKYHNFLQTLGAHKGLQEKIEELLSPLANSLSIMFRNGNKNGNMIEHFGTVVFND